jgi:hypothetical protein
MAKACRHTRWDIRRQTGRSRTRPRRTMPRLAAPLARLSTTGDALPIWRRHHHEIRLRCKSRRTVSARFRRRSRCGERHGRRGYTSLALEYAHRFMTSPAAALRHIRVWPKTGEDQAAEFGHHALRRACDHRRQRRVAQFIYLLLHNEKIRDVIDTIGKRARSCWAASLKAGCERNCATSASCRWSSTSTSPRPRTSARGCGCCVPCPTS